MHAEAERPSPGAAGADPPKVLIVGAGGHLGRDLLRLAEGAHDLSVMGLGRGELDLAVPETVDAAIEGLEFDILVNCAAYTAVDAAEDELGAAFAVNAYGVEALASVCARRGARFIHISTDYVFDGRATTPYQPEDAPAPLNVYGASKLVGESLARRVHPEGTCIVRTASLFGSAAAPERGGTFLEAMLRARHTGGPLRVVSDNIMAPTYVPDLAAGLLALLHRGAPAGVYHYTSTGTASWHEFAMAIFEAAGARTTVEAIPSADYPTRTRRPRYSVLDTRSGSGLMGAAPHWRDALERYFSLRRDHGSVPSVQVQP